LFEYASIRALSRHIAQNAAGQQGNAAVNIRSERTLAEPSPQALPDDYRHNVAVIGMSCQFPGADNPAAFWNNLLEGRESIRHLEKGELLAQGVSPQMAARPDYVPVSATVAGKSLFDPEFFMLSPKDAALMDPQARLLLLNAWWAVEDAGYAVPHIPNTAVYMSVSTNFYQQPDLTQAGVLENSAGYVSWLYSQSGTVPALISYHLGLTGPSYAIHSNCSSALSGLYAAYQSLRAGEVEYALVGAATLHSADSLGYIHQPGLNFSADGRLKAFDTAADGMVGSEGVAVLLLKNAHAAIRDNDAIYGLLRGIAMNNDGMDKAGFYAPGVRGQAAVIEKALQVSGVAPETLGYVEAHGTGTRLGDPIEIAALSGVFRRYTDKIGFCGIGSVKTNIGHTDTVAGLAGCIKVLHALHHGQIPASLHYREANPEMHLETSPFYVVDQLTDWPAAQHPRRAALSSFGIGGTNVHAIFEAYSANAARPQPSRLAQYIIPLSAKNAARLAEYATRLLEFLTAGENDDSRLDELASTLQLGRSAMACRVAFLVTDKEELIQKLTAYIAGERHIVGVCYGETQPTSELLRQLEGDEETDTLVASWIERQKFAKLATLWCQGLNLDWTRLYGSVRPRRVRLPGYPFARHSCWRAAPASPQARRDVETLSTRLRATADNEF
ncbi:MAG: beta-ketoacyl synthase N-terminal-like domain-containing protein, partial [Enterobacter roggenkampii]